MALRKQPKVPTVVLKAALRAEPVVTKKKAAPSTVSTSPARAKIIRALKKLHPMD